MAITEIRKVWSHDPYVVQVRQESEQREGT